jgi:hypothetical protein
MNSQSTQANSATEILAVSGSSQHYVASTNRRGDQIFAKIQRLRISQIGEHRDKVNFDPPRSFDEFYSRFPRHVHNFVRRHMIYQPHEEQWDRESELLYFLMTLPETSKYRHPGTNGNEAGCFDRIMTFDSARYVCASPGLFLSYVNRILLNRLRSLEQRDQSNPITRKGTLRLSDDEDEDSGISTSDSMHIDRVSHEVWMGGLQQDGEVWSHAVAQEFVAFIKRYNLELLPVLNSLSLCRRLGDAQAGSGLNERAFPRARARLRMLYRCFQSGSKPPKQRRLYRK